MKPRDRSASVRVGGLLAACASLLAACASLLAACASPPARLYTLMPPEPAPQVSAGAVRFRVAITRMELPEALDRPQLVIRAGLNRLIALEQERWAERLHESLPRLLREDLSRELPDAMVLLDGDAAGPKPDIVVRLEFERLELIPGENVLIEARGWLNRPAHTAAAPLHLIARAPVHGGRQDFEALVAANASALASLSADLARAIESARAQ